MAQNKKKTPLSRRSQNLWTGIATTGVKEEAFSDNSVISSLFSAHAL